MGLDEDIREVMNRDLSVPSMTVDEGSHDQNNQRRPAIMKQPPPKKAQRQFERLWNTSKPGGENDEEYDQYDDGGYNSMPPPGQSMLGNQGGQWPRTGSLLGGPRGMHPPPGPSGIPPMFDQNPYQQQYGGSSWRNGPPPPSQGPPPPHMFNQMPSRPPPQQQQRQYQNNSWRNDSNNWGGNNRY